MPATSAPRRIDGLRLIGLLKLTKAVLILLTLYGANWVLKSDITDQLYHWGETLTDDEERALVLRVLDWISRLNPHSLANAATVTLAYVGLLTVEGMGLWLRKRWAEWVAIIATSSLIPIEFWKLVWRTPKHPWILGIVLALNIIIVIYLWTQLRKKQVPA